jgi:hypothetical protein
MQIQTGKMKIGEKSAAPVPGRRVRPARVEQAKICRSVPAPGAVTANALHCNCQKLFHKFIYTKMSLKVKINLIRPYYALHISL